MPDQVVSGPDAARRREEATNPKILYALDARVPHPSPWSEPAELLDLARSAVVAGSGHVLRESLVVFDNAAITLVLVLAESHLSIHTWPEEDLVAVDLFSCGTIDGERVVHELRTSLQLRDVRLRRLGRGL